MGAPPSSDEPARSRAWPSVPDLLRPKVILRADALRSGMNPDDVQAKRRRREWVSLRSGVYVEASVLGRLNPVERHLLLVDATMPNVDSDALTASTYGDQIFAPFRSPDRVRRVANGAARCRRTGRW